ncbi:DNA-directed RNA polymerase subunit beta [Nocardia takedensis]|uniref:hypothetical protein n=1 Tax=Nocardia takedensis TaxID=259390 RepID=UPI0002F5B43E|nr:hypothetical protein [Nocardia takedensis]
MDARSTTGSLPRVTGGGPSDTPATRHAFYRDICGLPAELDAETGRITLRARAVTGIVAPAGLGQIVKVDLDRRAFVGVPIVSHPRSATWTFLVRADVTREVIARDAPLWRNRITVLEGEAAIALPSPTDRGVFHRAWITPLRPDRIPSGLTVVDAIRFCLTARSA